jgi:hypothetical protein
MSGGLDEYLDHTGGANLGHHVVIPHYGNWSGAGRGVDNLGSEMRLIMNQIDFAAHKHDTDGQNEAKWMERCWSTTPDYQYAGPVGALQVIVGTPFFALKGWSDGEFDG